MEINLRYEGRNSNLANNQIMIILCLVLLLLLLAENMDENMP